MLSSKSFKSSKSLTYFKTTEHLKCPVLFFHMYKFSTLNITCGRDSYFPFKIFGALMWAWIQLPVLDLFHYSISFFMSVTNSNYYSFVIYFEVRNVVSPTLLFFYGLFWLYQDLMLLELFFFFYINNCRFD